MSQSSFTIVFFATPVIRTVLLMLFPSQRHRTTCARWAAVSCFILTILHDRLCKCKHYFQHMLALCRFYRYYASTHMETVLAWKIPT